ncbi:MAG: hypothetical protein ABI208_05620 [Ginsengibacter sp.]|jgi:hypothetical protein
MSEEKELPPDETPITDELADETIQPNEQPVLFPEYTDENEQQETNIENPQTEKMEIPEFPHHVLHKKKWGEYLLEFFMLFFAVFLGFIAENIRESQVEKVKEKEYMVSLLSDLQQDTLESKYTINANSLYIAGEDSTLNLLSGNIHNQDTAELALVYFYKYCIYNTTVIITDGTISQLKNSGGLRLLKNKEVTNDINKYYNSVAFVKMQEEAIKVFLNITSQQAGGIFNYAANRNFIDSINATETDITELSLPYLKGWLTHGKPTMITTDNKNLSPFMNNMSYQIGLMRNYNFLINDLRLEAIDLIKSIRKNYHLKDE